MTIFRRRGFYRDSKSGTRHWVSTTTVRRNDWDRCSCGYTPSRSVSPLPPPRDPFLDRYPEFSKVRRHSACFVNPNARCPVCGASVYYYQNELGSRVFFDELVPPWPKHPCTDLQSIAVVSSDRAFAFRSQVAIAEISVWQKERGIDCTAEFEGKYGNSPWPLATIVKRMKSGKLVFLVLNLLQRGHTKKVYASCNSLPKCCRDGFAVAIRGQKISFFDTAAMTPREVRIRRYRGSSAFFDAMIELGTYDL